MCQTEPSRAGARTYRYLDIISVVFVVVLLISNITAIKPLALPAWLHVQMDGGNILFPVSYIFGDILVEVYGYARSRRVIWLGFAANAIAALVFSLVVALPAAPGWDLQSAFSQILGQTPRVVLASLCAFLCGEFMNSFIMAKMKLWSRGRLLWTRTIGSTVVGEFVDSALFTLIAFAGVWSGETMIRVIAGNYIFKVAYEVLATPLTYAIVGALKRAEREDYYDRETIFNPFSLRI
jgi:queuosine precursor transporter